MLAERTENYIQKKAQERTGSPGGIRTKTGIEHRPSKQRRIQEAIDRNT